MLTYFFHAGALRSPGGYDHIRPTGVRIQKATMAPIKAKERRSVSHDRTAALAAPIVVINVK